MEASDDAGNTWTDEQRPRAPSASQRHMAKTAFDAHELQKRQQHQHLVSTSESSRNRLFSLVFSHLMTESFAMATGPSSDHPDHPASAIKLDVTLLNNSGDWRDSKAFARLEEYFDDMDELQTALNLSSKPSTEP